MTGMFPSEMLHLYLSATGKFLCYSEYLLPYLGDGALKRLLKAISELIMNHKHKMP